MVTVEVDPVRVESRLAAGELRCSACPDGVLAGWGFARSRRVVGLADPVRPRRSRCRGCAVTHVLLPVSLLLRRAYAAERVWAVLEAKAEVATAALIAEAEIATAAAAAAPAVARAEAAAYQAIAAGDWPALRAVHRLVRQVALDLATAHRDALITARDHAAAVAAALEEK